MSVLQILTAYSAITFLGTGLALVAYRIRTRRSTRAANVAEARAELAAETAEYHHLVLWKYEQAKWIEAGRPIVDVTAEKVSAR